MEEAKTFRAAFCASERCLADDYAERVLWRCHHRRSLVLGRLLWRLDPGYYATDLELIRAVADCQSSAEVVVEVGNFRGRYFTHGLFRKILHVRLSGQRLVDLAARLLGEKSL